jgi:hypothetical protein
VALKLFEKGSSPTTAARFSLISVRAVFPSLEGWKSSSIYLSIHFVLCLVHHQSTPGVNDLDIDNRDLAAELTTKQISSVSGREYRL